jgi:hypothetical protein
MNRKEFAAFYLGNFDSKKDPIDDLAEEYDRVTEAYDRTVCAGPIVDGEIMPASYMELSLVNQNAKRVLNDLSLRAWKIGCTQKQLLDAIRRFTYKRR